jgi:hypothetical protein
VEVTGLVSRDAYDWLIEVDPDRIVTLAGTGSGAAASSNGPPDGASPSAEAASDAPGSEGGASDARGQAHGLSHSAGGGASPDAIVLIALLGGGLALLAVFGFAAARAARRGRLRRLGRPAHSIRDVPEAQEVGPK